MASEANMVEGKEKEKGVDAPVTYGWQGAVKDEPQPQPQPQTEETTHPTEETTTKTEKVVPPVSTTTPPPAPENDSETPPALPPRPPQKEAPLRPLPPSHPATRGQDRAYPQPFPVGTYDPDHVHPDEHELANPPDTRWDFIKLILWTLSLLFSAVMIGLGVAIASWGGTFSVEEAQLGATSATAALAMVWTVAEVLTVCCSRHRRGMHPGAHVAFHLIICLLAIGCIAFIAILQEEYYYDGYRNSWEELAPVHKLPKYLLAFTGCLLGVHLMLFLRACVETHRLNRLKIRYVQVPVPGQPGPGMSDVPYHPYPGGAGEKGAAGMPWPMQQTWPNSYQQPPPLMALPQTPGQMMYGQPQRIGPVSPQQAALYGEYYAPAAQPIDPSSVYAQPPPSVLLNGYYGPPPERRSSNSRARHSQQSAPSAVASGSGSGRSRRQ